MPASKKLGGKCTNRGCDGKDDKRRWWKGAVVCATCFKRMERKAKKGAKERAAAEKEAAERARMAAEVDRLLEERMALLMGRGTDRQAVKEALASLGDLAEAHEAAEEAAELAANKAAATLKKVTNKFQNKVKDLEKELLRMINYADGKEANLVDERARAAELEARLHGWADAPCPKSNSADDWRDTDGSDEEYEVGQRRSSRTAKAKAKQAPAPVPIATARTALELFVKVWGACKPPSVLFIFFILPSPSPPPSPSP
jgi:hypothetical protein